MDAGHAVLERLLRRRRGLPASDQPLFEASLTVIGGRAPAAARLGNFNHLHAACFVPHGRPQHVLAYGENRAGSDHQWTVHAEVAAIRALPPLPPGRRRKQKIDLYVVRTSLTGHLGLSKPCAHCIEALATLPNLGYKLCDVYYTSGAEPPDSDVLRASRFAHLCCEPTPHISKYYRVWTPR